jgi:hypothetical protein
MMQHWDELAAGSSFFSPALSILCVLGSWLISSYREKLAQC